MLYQSVIQPKPVVSLWFKWVLLSEATFYKAKTSLADTHHSFIEKALFIKIKLSAGEMKLSWDLIISGLEEQQARMLGFLSHEEKFHFHNFKLPLKIRAERKTGIILSLVGN